MRALPAIVLSLALAACQSAGVDALEDAAGGPPRADETLGTGATGVVMLLPLSAGGETGRRARDIRDGAALALEELDDGKLAVTIRDTGGGGIAALAERAAGARLILGPLGAEQVSALMAVSARPPVLAFGSNGGPHGNGVFAVETDAVDSALDAARIAAGAGRKTFAAIVSQGFPEADRARLARGLAGADASLAGFVEHSGSATGLAGRIGDRRDLLLKADGVIVFGDGLAPAEIAAALREAGALQPGAVLIGNLAWASQNFSRAELEGALVAMPDQSSLALVADRYRARTGRALTIHAAYGYDAAAIAAGIVRAAGPEALTVATLTKNSGFRGTTGIFRFRPDGSVDRPLALYQIKGGSLRLLDTVPEGF